MFVKKGMFSSKGQFIDGAVVELVVTVKEGWLVFNITKTTNKDFKNQEKTMFTLFPGNVSGVLSLIKKRIAYKSEGGAAILERASVKEKNKDGAESRLSIVYVTEGESYFVGIQNAGKLQGVQVSEGDMECFAIILDEFLRKYAVPYEYKNAETTAHSDLPVINVEAPTPAATAQSKAEVTIPEGDAMWAALGGIATGKVETIDENGQPF